MSLPRTSVRYSARWSASTQPRLTTSSHRRGVGAVHGRHRRHSRYRRPRDYIAQEGPRGPGEGTGRQRPKRSKGKLSFAFHTALSAVGKPPAPLPGPPSTLEKGEVSDNRPQKAIKALIEQRFDKINTQARSTSNMPTPPSAPATSDEAVRPTPKRERSETNGHAEDEDDEDVNGEIEVSLSDGPAKKKQKRTSSVDEDARLAAELQAQENRLARGRTTRGGGTSKPSKPKKKTPKKKSAARIKGEEDSDVESSEASGVAKDKKKAGGGFQKPFNLSFPLGELCGETQVRFSILNRARASRLTQMGSSRGPRWSRSSGSTSRRTTSKTPTTSGRYGATT